MTARTTWTAKDILRAVDRMDFARIRKAMVALKWHWASVQGGGVPDYGEIRRAAIENARAALDEFNRGGCEWMRCSSGGLSAFVSASEIRVEFVVESGILDKESE
jgi:hypothetical protein